MPLEAGIRCGVNVTGTSPPSSCSISGVCLWHPILYALKPCATSTKEVSTDAFLPAPDTPLLESMMKPLEASESPFFTSGESASMAPVG